MEPNFIVYKQYSKIHPSSFMISCFSPGKKWKFSGVYGEFLIKNGDCTDVRLPVQSPESCPYFYGVGNAYHGLKIPFNNFHQ